MNVNKVSVMIEPPEPRIIEGHTNFRIVNTVKYISLAMFIILFVAIIFNKLKRKKLSKVIIILFVIFLAITFLSFFTGVYENFMTRIFPYYYGV